MSLIDRSHAAVFESLPGLGSRHAFSEQRFSVAARARASALVRVQGEAQPAVPDVRIRFGGVLSLRGPQARVQFRQGSCGEIDESAEPDIVDTQLLPAGTSLPLNESPTAIHRTFPPAVLVWISFVDCSGAPLSAPICIGRAGRDPLHVEPLFELPVLATLWLTARCLSKQGPILDLTGELQIRDGIVMRVAFASGCNRFGTPFQAGETVDVQVVARGGSLPIPPRRVSAPVRGTPLVSLEVRDWDGRRAGVEMPVGWITRLK